VGVGLVGSASGEPPCSRRQRGGHVEDGFAGGDKLLGQQRSKPAGGLDCPGPRCEWFGESKQPLALASICDDAELPDELFADVEDGGGVRPLVGVDPDHVHGACPHGCPLW